MYFSGTSRELGDKNYENKNPFDLLHPDSRFGFLPIRNRNTDIDVDAAWADGDGGGGYHLC